MTAPDPTTRLRSVLITGSGSGIGAETARRLAGPGTGVVVHAATNADGCARVAEQVRERGGRAAVVLGDLADPAVARRLVDTAVARHGGLDVLVANAGFPDRRPVGELDRAGLDRCLDVITGGFFELLDAARDHLLRSPAGRVVAISSHNAHVFRSDYPNYPASAAAKAAVEAMARATAVPLAPHGVTVNVVVPGLVRKSSGEQFLDPDEWAEFPRRIPMGRIGEPHEVAAVVAFLVSTDASYVTGQIVHVNGGFV